MKFTDLFTGMITEAKANFVEVEGIRVVPNSLINNMLVKYDDIERTNRKDHPGVRPGVPLSYEISLYRDDYGIDIEHMSKGEFPISKDNKTGIISKVAILGEFDVDYYEVEIFRLRKGQPMKTVYVHGLNDLQSFMIHKDDVKDLENLNSKAFNKVWEAAS